MDNQELGKYTGNSHDTSRLTLHSYLHKTSFYFPFFPCNLVKTIYWKILNISAFFRLHYFRSCTPPGILFLCLFCLCFFHLCSFFISTFKMVFPQGLTGVINRIFRGLASTHPLFPHPYNCHSPREFACWNSP